MPVCITLRPTIWVWQPKRPEYGPETSPTIVTKCFIITKQGQFEVQQLGGNDITAVSF